jgi:hypothetical protein
VAHHRRIDVALQAHFVQIRPEIYPINGVNFADATLS